MKLRKNLGRLATAFVATAMLASVAAVPASAADAAPTTSDEHVKFTSTLNLIEGENGEYVDVPKNATFTYTVGIPEGTKQGEVINANPEIMAGILPTTTITGTANFSDNSWDEDTHTTTSDTVDLDFSDVVFTEPGVYRYVVTETMQSGNSSDITRDEVTTRYLDVYVQNGNLEASDPADKYTVYSYVLLKKETNPSSVDVDGKTQYQYGEIAKNEGYISSYETNELDLSKLVEGDLGNKNPGAFNFNVTISGLTNGSTIGVSEDGKTYTKSEGATNGSVTINNVKLGNNEHYYVCGLPTGVTVTVTETDMENAGYKTTYVFNGGEAKNGTTTTELSIEDKDNGVANTLVFTNDKKSVSPTGIVMNVAPYALLVVVAAGACFVFLRKRRED